MSEQKAKILFVGSFSEMTKYAHTGGIMFACDTLLSRLKNEFDWILIDSTASTNNYRSVWERATKALKRVGKLKKSLLFDKIDIVILFSAEGFSFSEKGVMALIAKLFGKKVIFAPRSGLLLDSINTSKSFRYWAKFVLSKVDRVLCQSEFWKDYFLSLVGDSPDKYVVIHNWIDAEIYFNNRPSYIKKTLDEPINILFLGWITQNKGIFDIIDAADNLRDHKIRFIIAGEGDASEEVAASVERRRIAHMFDFRGWVKGKRKLELFKESDILVLASYREGYPNALIEAMASSLAVVSSKVGSTPDLIQDKVNGHLYDPGNVPQLTEKLERLILDENERIRMATNAKERIASNNTIDIGSSKFLQMVKSLV